LYFAAVAGELRGLGESAVAVRSVCGAFLVSGELASLLPVRDAQYWRFGG
jgi:hypothetical protein